MKAISLKRNDDSIETFEHQWRKVKNLRETYWKVLIRNRRIDSIFGEGKSN